jgi:hypothetical protein
MEPPDDVPTSHQLAAALLKLPDYPVRFIIPGGTYAILNVTVVESVPWVSLIAKPKETIQ